MKIYSPKSIIFPEPACYEYFIILNETKKTHTCTCKILIASLFLGLLERCLRHLKITPTTSDEFQVPL